MENPASEAAGREIPFFRPSIGEREIAAVVACLRSGWLTTGPVARSFEASFSDAIGEGVASVAVTSATAAMHLGLEGLGVGPGDEVILPTLTFTATAEVIRYLGATPIFVDIDRDTLCIGPAQVEPAITSRTRVIMPVHFGGRCCDMTGLRALADRSGLKILDDAAHAFPASHAGQPIGRCGADATAFSFYANKTITTGEGGMLVTRDPALAARARTMRLHGIDRDVFNRFTDRAGPWSYDVVAPGYKYNMTDIAAAMGSVQLDRRTEFHLKRTRLAARYDDALHDLPVILPPQAAEGDVHSWHLYLLQLRDDANISREDFIQALRDKGISCSVHYRPLHQMSFWKPFCTKHDFPNAEDYYRRCISLPLFMAMSDDEQSYVIDAIRKTLVR